MKLVVRFRGTPVTRIELQPERVYTVGRSAQNDIHYAHRALSRRQGRLEFDGSGWRFLAESSQEGAERELRFGTSGRIELANGLELIAEQSLDDELTHLTDLGQLDVALEKGSSRGAVKSRRRVIVATAAAVFATVLTLFGIQAFQKLYGPMDSSQLMAFASPKVIKFELVKNETVQNALKKDANLKDDDFRETVGYCTGFLVDTNVVLTAGHCYFGGSLLDASNKFILRTHDGKVHKATRVLGFDIQRDFLYLETEGLESYGKLAFATRAEVGDKVYTLGNVEGEGLALRDGIISGETEDNNNPEIKFLRYSAGASPGNSGGPLLNARGEIVALVFARNMSENYNLGTGAEHLRLGFETFVANRDDKEIKVDSKALLGFSPTFTNFSLMASLGLPYPGVLRENPEMGRVLENLEFNVKLPSAVEALAGEVAVALNKVSRERLAEAGELIKGKNLPGEDWKSQMTKDVPMIVPSTQPSSGQTVFTDIGGGVIAPETFDFVEPGGSSSIESYLDRAKKHKVYEYSAQTWSSPMLRHRFDDFGGKKVFANLPDNNKDKMNLQMLMYETIDSYFPDSSYGTLDQAALDAEVRKLLAGKEGLLVSPMIFPFIRPKGSRNFTLAELPSQFKTVRSVKDTTGREWTLSSMKLYDRLALDNWCTRALAGRFCMTVASIIENDELADVRRENLVVYKLSNILLTGEFVSPSKIEADAAGRLKSQDVLWSDFRVRREGGRLRIGLRSLGHEIEIGEESQIASINLLPGLVRGTEGEEPRWMGLGVSWIKRAGTGAKGRTPASAVSDSYQLCTAAIDFKAIQYHPLADLTSPVAVEAETRGPSSVGPPLYLRGALKKTQLWTEELKSTGAVKREGGKVFGTCVPMSEKPGDPGYLKLDLKKASAQRVAHSLLKVEDGAQPASSQGSKETAAIALPPNDVALPSEIEGQE